MPAMQTGRCGVSPLEGAARNGVRARGRLSPLKYKYGSFFNCSTADEPESFPRYFFRSQIRWNMLY